MPKEIKRKRAREKERVKGFLKKGGKSEKVGANKE